MKKILFLLIIIACASAPLAEMYAQTETLVNRQSNALSPSEKRYNRTVFDVELHRQQGLYANPAYYEYRNDSARHTVEGRHAVGSRYKSGVIAGYSAGELDGDYLIYEGNRYSDYRITGFGEYSLPGAGTIYGTVQYAGGEHRNIGWNAVRYPELYLPYLSTDSVGGDFRFEDYSIKGGYSFRLGSYFLGVSGEFHGEQAYRITDPRAVNNTTWLHVDAGVARLFGSHLWMLQAGYERHKQHISMRYWRTGQQDRFFVGYGFGLYDVKQSTVSFGYSRMYYLEGANVALAWQSPEDRALSGYARLAYQYTHVKTEESSIRDLYFYDAHTVSPSLLVRWKASSSVCVDFSARSHTELRKGSENIFEQYKVDDINNVYDFRLIDTRQTYQLLTSENDVQLKAAYSWHNRHSVELLGGASLSLRDEKYKSEDYLIRNTALRPHAGLGYRWRGQQSEFDISCLYIRQLLLDNTYRVDIQNTNVEHLDFQQAFSPFAYRNSTYSAWNLGITYVRHLKKKGVGGSVKFMLKRGDRDGNCSYTQKIGFDSSAPKLKTTPDKHDETWGSASVFWVF